MDIKKLNFPVLNYLKPGNFNRLQIFLISTQKVYFTFTFDLKVSLTLNAISVNILSVGYVEFCNILRGGLTYNEINRNCKKSR